MAGKLKTFDWDGEDFDLDAMLDYLDTLRVTAVTNMNGAGTWLQNAFDLDRKTAQKVLNYWRETFEIRHPKDISERM